MSKKRLHILLKGRVQGVFFRASTAKKARSLGLTGFVKNLPAGGVEIEAEGEKEDLKKLLEWAKEGPDHARVKDLEKEYKKAQGEFDQFEIRR